MSTEKGIVWSLLLPYTIVLANKYRNTFAATSFLLLLSPSKTIIRKSNEV